MSNIENAVLLEFAYETAEAITNHPSGYDKVLLKAIADGDLDEVRRLLAVIEGTLSQEHFFNEDILHV